ncbi:hypothetical protein CN172_27545 [Sinorhizobium meliloti]|nr:hypothetical protein CN232_08125 [Sinorhizobium meliloti]RVH46295.1 hypothetical protein CN208_07820 [Sinorhizobium meliloti]RVK07116.1 hypothetical protein CN172_27545 [Sinorhizobium meliloti]
MSNWGDGLDRRGFTLSSIARPRFWPRSEYCESRGAGWRCPTCQPIGKESGFFIGTLDPGASGLGGVARGERVLLPSCAAYHQLLSKQFRYPPRRGELGAE